jgi:hypothetical protein
MPFDNTSDNIDTSNIFDELSVNKNNINESYPSDLELKDKWYYLTIT